MLQKDKSVLQNFTEATQYEWLETNGLGGWSSSSIIGCNTRRYHGLLVAATKPPAERMNLVSKLEETIILNDERLELGSNQYRNDITHPQGYNYLQSFTKDFFPEWVYEANGIKLKKTIAMIHGENTTVVLYQVLKAAQPLRLELLPLFSMRGYHSLMHANDAVNREAVFANETFKTTLYNGTPEIYINVPGGHYQPNPNWFYNFNYAEEKHRGLDFEEDLFTPGYFTIELGEGSALGIILSTENTAGKNAIELLQKEKSRREKLLIGQPADETVQQLILAADQFIVKRGEDFKTVIAGYHWFTDWGRDTMISLPGLCLATGRLDDAKKILSAFANSVSMGMLPNCFQDNNEPPAYNNVDGALWYFIAVYKYLQAGDDKKFILHEILPVLKDIIDWHFKGTRYNIQVEEDGLLYAGEDGQQLTWMDARIGTWVVTPRMGKPVEIQALWYNALKIFSYLLGLNNQSKDAIAVNKNAAKAKQRFIEKFWYAEGNYLYDNIDGQGNAINELRPNQLFAISLPFTLIDDEKKAGVILNIVEENLYTPVGLKSLPESDVQYIPVYGGDAWHRDSAYHQGTVWSWLLGPYIDAVIKTQGTTKGKAKAMKVIDDFKYHLNEGCIGSVSEIFDAAAPHHPRGCIAQAWGVAEILRVIKEYGLTATIEKKQ